MFYLDSSNNRYFLGRAFTYGDIQYSAKAATAAKFHSLGFTQVNPVEQPDSTYYYVSGVTNQGTYNTTDRPLNEVKLKLILDEKVQARSYLALTDWMVTRNQETSEAIPANVATYRAAVRTANTARCNEINACTTISELETLIKAPAQIEDPSNPGSYIANPAARTPYPDMIDETDQIISDYSL